ncbi:MAG: YMGG-like glycine zipper-containing protein [Verrucomicrobiota bacterium]
MKKWFVIMAALLTLAFAAQAGGHRYFCYRGCSSPRVSFYWSSYPCYTPWYSYSYAPVVDYDDTYSRPNYAVNGALTGALLGGLIGESSHHRGWEGAGIGAAAGLLLGGLAEHNARSYERAYVAPRVSRQQTLSVPAAPTVNTAPTVPDAPRVPDAPTYRPASAMSGANALFGR